MVVDRVRVGLGRLVGFFGDRNVFPRLRTPPWVGAHGVRLYVEGLRRIFGMLCGLGFQVSRESVWGWFYILSGWPIYVWVAVDVDAGGITAVYSSRGRPKLNELTLVSMGSRHRMLLGNVW